MMMEEVSIHGNNNNELVKLVGGNWSWPGIHHIHLI